MKKPGKRDWTWLVFMAADNDLVNHTGRDLCEMHRAKPANMAIAAHVDQPARATRWLEVLRDRNRLQAWLLFNFNSGNPAVLASFLRWGMWWFRAPRYAAILWSHGYGWLDFPTASTRRLSPKLRAVPRVFFLLALFFRLMTKLVLEAIAMDKTAKDALDTSELRAALLAAKRRDTFAIIGCDACLMNMIEVAYEIHDCGEVMVGTQDMELENGWPYDEILSRFTPKVLTSIDAAKAIVEGYAKTNGPDMPFSAIDLRKVRKIVEAMDSLGEALKPLVKDRIVDFAIARGKCRSMGLHHYVDLRDFVEKLRDQLNDGKVTSAADAVIKAVDDAIIARQSVASTAYGISVYVPNQPVHKNYDHLMVCKAAKGWCAFVTAYGDIRGSVS